MARTTLKKHGGHNLRLEMFTDAETGRPFVAAAGQRYGTLAALTDSFPELRTEAELPLYCELFLHFFPGPGCVLIEDADEFRDRYEALLCYGADGAMQSAADFGPFDVSEIDEPKGAGGKLLFYAESALYSVPYRVEVPWPHREHEPVEFQLLPLRD